MIVPTRVALAAAFCAAAASGATARAQEKTLTLEQTTGPGRVNFGGVPPQVRFTPAGDALEIRRDGKTIWRDLKTGAERPAPDDAANPAPAPAATPARGTAAGGRASAAALAIDPKEAECVAALAKLAGFDEASARRVVSGRVGASSDGAAQLFESDGDLFFFRSGRERALRLTFTPQLEREAMLSPDGRFASFVRDHDLFLVETDGGRERAVTSDGGPEKLNGILDWVYQEEVYGRGNWNAHWWSPDSRHLAFLSLAQTGVPHHPIVDQAPPEPELEDTRYPKPGDPNPKVALASVRVRDAKVTWVDLSKYEHDDPLVVRVGFTPDGSRLVFQVQDREQTWLDLDFADAETGKVETLFRESSATWVNVLDEPRWLADGGFLWLSERSGTRHLYRFDAKGKLLQQVTDGPWEVRAVTDVDEPHGRVFFTASRDGAIGPNLYRVNLDGGGLTRITQGRGSHSVEWNKERSHLLDRVSSLSSPPEVRLCDADGNVLEVVAKTEIPALKEYRFSAPELLTIPTRDGFPMDAVILKPVPFDPKQKYPVWLPTYSGPDAPSVSDRWSGDPWLQFLAQHGIAVLQVNNRTSSQKGHACVSKCWQQLGVQELADLEDALAWLGQTQPWADTSRVGITGWSYGGFMTAFALTHSKAFKVGIAGAGVYDWRLYDSIYTERYMRTPQHDPDGYAKTSVIDAAKDLSGYLVLAHGAIDDNVHLQNTVQLALALQKADREFEMMLYPRSRHGIASPEQNLNFRRLTWKTIRERL
jgi:dipeptidyl-peptidase-4